jgi:hypothetical protein
MAVNGTHNTGEEWKQKSIFRQDTVGARAADITVHLYNDSMNPLSESSDWAAVNGEPTDGNYAAQTLSLDSTDLSMTVSSGDLVVSGTVSYDVLDTGETVDGWVATVDFKSDVVNAESSVNKHILASATFNGGQEDMSNYSSFDVTIQDTLS